MKMEALSSLVREDSSGFCALFFQRPQCFQKLRWRVHKTLQFLGKDRGTPRIPHLIGDNRAPAYGVALSQRAFSHWAL